MQRELINIIKVTYDKLTTDFILSGKKLKTFLEIQEQDRGTLLPLLLNIVLEVLNTKIRQEKEINIKTTHKLEGKNLNCYSLQTTQLFIQKTLRSLPPKVLELINEFRKVAGYKVNIQKSVALSYIYSEQSERERKKISVKITSKRIKYLGINLTVMPDV